MKIGQLRIQAWHIWIAAPLLLLMMFVLWFLLLRLDWAPAVRVPVNYDFRSELHNVTFYNDDYDYDVLAGDLQELIGSKDTPYIAMDFFNLNSAKDYNIYFKTGELDDIIKLLDPMYEDLHDDLQAYIELNIHDHNNLYSFETAFEGPDCLLSELSKILLVKFMYEVKHNRLERAQESLNRSFYIIKRVCGENAFPMDEDVRDCALSVCLAQHLNPSYKVEDAMWTEFIEEYLHLRPSYKQRLQINRIMTHYSLNDWMDSTDQPKARELLGDHYFDKDRAQESIDRAFYLLLAAHEDSEIEYFHKQLDVLMSDPNDWKLFFYRDLAGLITYHSTVEFRPTYYANEASKTKFMVQAALAYISILNYKKEHDALPKALSECSFVQDADIPVYYQQVSNTEWYVMSVNHLDMHTYAEKMELMHNYAYMYYEE